MKKRSKSKNRRNAKARKAEPSEETLFYMGLAFLFSLCCTCAGGYSFLMAYACAGEPLGAVGVAPWIMGGYVFFLSLTIICLCIAHEREEEGCGALYVVLTLSLWPIALLLLSGLADLF